jgi:dipeptidyl-peptidase 4
VTKPGFTEHGRDDTNVCGRLSAAAYERAERLLGHNRHKLALRTQVKPNWIGDGTAFWYRVDTERGTEFLIADPEAGSRRPAFDHERLARSLAYGSGERVAPYDLPFRTIDITADEITFTAFGTGWRCRLPDYLCGRDDRLRPRPLVESVSPDGRWAAFVRDHNLWLRSMDSGEETALTGDGTEDQRYAVGPDADWTRDWPSWIRRRVGASVPDGVRPMVLWSPDSTRILTHRLDQRGVAQMYLVESAPPDGGRPRLHAYRYAMPGEPLTRGEWLTFDIRSGTMRKAATEPFLFTYFSPIMSKTAWWSADGGSAYYLDQPRDLRTLSLKCIDPVTGDVRTLVEESGETRVEATQGFLEPPPMVRVLSGGREVLWYSERDGWGHLYLYDLSGGAVTQVTKGNYVVQQIVHVDETHRMVYLVVSGLVRADPYRRLLVSVSLAGGDLTVLTDDNLDHAISAPAHGRWFVDSASTVDTPPVTTVRGRDGSVLMELERADISRLIQAGWSPPERFRTLAGDGRTPVYGVLYKPYGFDSGERYPIIDHTYPGPSSGRVVPSFHPGRLGHDAEAVAALGFVVIAVDGRGTQGRDKAFFDHSYRNLGAAGALEDHVAALHQLAESRPWMDLEKIGIMGHSGGGFATARALLAYPETYKVGVAEAGNHDNRYYHAVWAEKYDGPFDPDDGARLSNTELAGNLTGKLLLIHGDMDDNVTPHLTMRLVDRLIAADKDFDLLIVPGAEHFFIGYEHYVTRRRWDYFVRHLMDREPPAYRLAEFPISFRLAELNLG